MPYTVDKDGNMVKTEAPKKPTVDNMREYQKRVAALEAELANRDAHIAALKAELAKNK